jgi:hypothetical protein
VRRDSGYPVLPPGWLLEELYQEHVNHSEDFKRPRRKVQVPDDVEVVMQEMWWEVRRYLSER